jgi:hypothetical protein
MLVPHESLEGARNMTEIVTGLRCVERFETKPRTYRWHGDVRPEPLLASYCTSEGCPWHNERVVRKPITTIHLFASDAQIQCQIEHSLAFTLCIAQYNTGYSVDIALPRIPKRRTRKQSLNQSAIPTSDYPPVPDQVHHHGHGNHPARRHLREDRHEVG